MRENHFWTGARWEPVQISLGKEFTCNLFTLFLNFQDGLFFDSKIASGGENFQGDVAPPNGVIPTTNDYDPRSPPNANGSRVWTQMER